MLSWLFSQATDLGVGVLNAMAASGEYRLLRDLVYCDEHRLRLDVYAPRAVVAREEPAAVVAAGAPAGTGAGETADEHLRAPVVVFFHGGRWTYGSKDHYRFLGHALARAGVLCVVAQYRLYPTVRFPAFVDDAARAVAWVRRNIASMDGDPGRIFVMGHSAGAHIAALLATDPAYLARVGEDKQWLAGMIGLAGPYDFLPIRDADLCDLFGPAEEHPRSQPIRHVRGDEPPMLLLHGDRDRTVGRGNSKRLAERVREAGGRAQTRLYPVGHLGIVATLSARMGFLAPTVADIVEFLRTTPGRGGDRAGLSEPPSPSAGRHDAGEPVLRVAAES
jgi:acetyl esterase/lipase